MPQTWQNDLLDGIKGILQPLIGRIVDALTPRFERIDNNVENISLNVVQCVQDLAEVKTRLDLQEIKMRLYAVEHSRHDIDSADMDTSLKTSSSDDSEPVEIHGESIVPFGRFY